MVSLLPTIIITIVAVILAISSANSGATAVVFALGGVAAIITTLWMLALASDVIECKVKIKEAIANLKVAKKRFEEIKEIVIENLKKFPLEAKLLEKLKSDELWEIPQIQSHEFLTKQIDTLVGEKKRVFNLLESINSERRELMHYRELVDCKLIFLPVSVFREVMTDEKYAEVLEEVGISEDATPE